MRGSEEAEVGPVPGRGGREEPRVGVVPGVEEGNVGPALGSLDDLRAPLARIALAASRLAREDVPPRARDLAATIREAAAELDERLDAARRRRGPAGAPAREPIGRTLEAWRGRMDPVLAARGLTLETRAPDELAVDPAALRRGLNALTRIALDSADAGPVLVELTPADDALCLRARWSTRSADRGARGSARRHTIAAGARLEHDATGATLWLPMEPARGARSE